MNNPFCDLELGILKLFAMARLTFDSRFLISTKQTASIMHEISL